MAHKAQREFCLTVKSRFPEYFLRKRVLDIGSLDINGSNRKLFTDCEYIGLDLEAGSNVNVICRAHEYNEPDESFDTIVSTEAFEHDKYLPKTLNKIVRLLKSFGLFFFTCATFDRPEHGTEKASPKDSPFTPDFYRPVTSALVKTLLDLDKFENYHIGIEPTHYDLQFWGIRNDL